MKNPSPVSQTQPTEKQCSKASLDRTKGKKNGACQKERAIISQTKNRDREGRQAPGTARACQGMSACELGGQSIGCGREKTQKNVGGCAWGVPTQWRLGGKGSILRSKRNEDSL